MNGYEFPVTVYGNLEKYNEVLSKARCRTFYKYENRNGTYITDEFAEELIKSLPYAPVKGIYDGDDYSDHGMERNEGRIYGIVPENPNVAWEEHLDEDGVTRIYACTDVLIFTALYKEANDIIGKSQSMELYGPSLKYHEAIIHNKRYIVFDKGCFLGLQILGDKVEPCFEGASFYTLKLSIQKIFDLIKDYGGTKMPKFNFKLSDDQKLQALWALLNPDCNEEGGWVVSYGIAAVYDDYALIVNYETGDYERAYYTKNDESDMIEITNRSKCFIVDVTESEKNTLDTLRALNGNTYELVSDVLLNAQDTLGKNSEFSAKIEELNGNISTLESEKVNLESQVADFTSQLERANNDIASLNEELTSLKEYKLAVETQRKEAVFEEYAEALSEEVIDAYRAKISEYTVEELDMHLAYELKKNNSSIFTKSGNEGYVPKDVPVEGIAAILSKYKK